MNLKGTVPFRLRLGFHRGHTGGASRAAHLKGTVPFKFGGRGG
jgi:hypothetical protein